MPSNSKIERFLSTVQTEVPNLLYKVNQATAHTFINFPCAPESEYNIEAWLYDDGEGSICARLKNESKTTEHVYFWYLSFELVDFDSIVELELEMQRLLILLLLYPTRIIQQKGFLFWNFTCEYQNDSGWKKLGGVSSLRATIKVPAITGKEKIYYAKPIFKPT